MKITFEDINRRVYRLNAKPKSHLVNMREAQIYTNKHEFCQNNAILAIENLDSLAENSNEAFNKALDIFDELCLNSNSKSVILNACNILVENVDKVRDQTQLANSLKYRMGIMRQKPTTKINRQYDDVSEKIRAALDAVNSALKTNLPGATTQSASAEKNDEVKEECYNEILHRCFTVKECDRILKNYNNVSKRFNLDRIVDNIRYGNDLYQACYEIASCIDTYGGSFRSKYNSALETTAYVFDKHFMNYPKNKIVEAVTDYFIFTEALHESEYEDVKYVIDISVLFEQNDFSSLLWMFPKEEQTEKETENISIVENYGVEFDYLTEDNLLKVLNKNSKAFKKDLKKSTKKLIKDAKEGNPEEHKAAEVRQMVDEFRAQCTKNPDSKANLSSLKALINKIFVKSPYQIVYELPNLLSLIKVAFVLGTAFIHPVIGIITFLTNELISVHLTRKQMEKVIKAYNNEIDSVKNKIEKAKDDRTKENLEAYLKELEKDLDKLEEYERTVYSEKENDERDEAKWASEDDDFNFDDDDEDFDFDFEEAASIICISNYLTSIQENLIDDSVDGVIYNNIFKLDNDSIDAVTDFVITVPVILEKDKLKEALINIRSDIRKSASSVSDYVRISCLNDNISKLENSSYSYSTSNTARDAMMYLACLNELTKIKSDNYIMEMDFSNTIKLAVNNLKRDAIKLSDKEKQMSNSIDIAANNVSKSLENAVKNGNREAVIRGSMIPSASKCIKLALAAGVAWAINPAVAVIGAIGAFACSKKMQAKERQLVLDDIEIELKMCERYMRAAEDEGDMKKIRQIEVIQRNLERQRQRIKYRMSVVYNQKVPEVGSHDNDD